MASHGERIKRARQRRPGIANPRRALTQEELAGLVPGVTYKTLQRIEQGKVKDSPQITLLLDYFGLPHDLDANEAVDIPDPDPDPRLRALIPQVLPVASDDELLREIASRFARPGRADVERADSLPPGEYRFDQTEVFGATSVQDGTAPSDNTGAQDG